MTSVIVFIKQHWELCLAFVLILIYWLTSEAEEAFNQHSILPAEAVKLMNHHQALVMDIRDTEHFKAGHILGAVSYPYKELLADLTKIKKYRNKKIILVDISGKLSNKIINKILSSGHTEIFFIKNGMHAWLKDKLPLHTERKK